MRRFIAIVLILGIAGAGAWYLNERLSSGEVLTVEQHREKTLRELAEGRARPDLSVLQKSAADLEAALTALDETASRRNMKTAHEAWHRARQAWRRAAWLGIGRPAELFLDRAIDGARDENQIERVLASKTEINQDWVAAQGGGVRGFSAIEYVLFRPQSREDRSRRLLLHLGADLRAKIDTFVNIWLEGQLADFEDPEAVDSGPWSNRREVIDALVNRLVTLAVGYRDRELAPLVNATAGGKVQVRLMDSDPAQVDAEDLKTAYRSLRDVYGDSGEHLSGLVAAASPRIDEAVRRRLDLAAKTMRKLPDSLDEATGSLDPVLQEAYDTSTGVKIALGTDLVAALDTTLSLTLNDGD